MSKVSVVGSINCQEGKEDEMEKVLTKMVEACQGEPGVEIYSYHRDESNKFWFFALMSNAEAMQSHGQSPAMQEVMAEFMPLMSSPPEMTTCNPFAAIGLDV